MENTNVVETAARPALTHCAICHLPLTDAESVEVGIGPICRERCEYDKIPAALRVRANALIAKAALSFRDPTEVRFVADELRTMGLDRLAACLMDKFAVIFLSETQTEIAALTPYVLEFNHALRTTGIARWSWNGRKMRYFKRGRGAWTMPKTGASRDAFWCALTVAFPGMVVKITGQAVPVFLDGKTMPSLQADAAPEKSTNDHAREIRAVITSMDFGGRKTRFDAFSFSVAAANAGYDAEMFLASPVRALREHAVDAAKILDAKPPKARARRAAGMAVAA